LSKVERKITGAERMADDESRADLLQGTLDLLILHALSLGPMHGWGLSRRIRQLSQEVLQVNQGSLYPALHRLEYRGLVHSEWGTSENNRRAKIYSMTGKGEARLGIERRDWARFVRAMQWVLDTTEPDPTTA
jgi:PadR family transcriptional regulator PadR